MKILQNADIAALDLVIFRRIGELQRHYPEIHQVLAVDASKPAGEHQAEAKLARRKRGVLTARSLPIVAAAHDIVAVDSLHFFRSLAVGPVYHAKGEFGDL